METRMRCAILDDYQNVALDLADWSPLEGRVRVEVLREHIDDPDVLAARLADFDILVVMRERTPLTAKVLAALPKLRLVVTSGMRNASIDLRAAAAQGVTVCGTASSSDPPSELTWALLLAMARSLVDEALAFRSGEPWQSTVGVNLRGKTLGLIGLGKIGSRVARYAAAFDMDVVAWSPHLDEERAAKVGVRLAPSLPALMEAADFVSIHLVLGATTRGIVDAAALARMKSTARLINTSRAGLVDLEALERALRSGAIAGAAIDVFDVEPLPAQHPWRSMPRLLATPHLGYVCESNYRVYFREAVDDIVGFLEGSPRRVLDAGPR
jgi:phosphoglycerate dehydrogenase-like enzyme